MIYDSQLAPPEKRAKRHNEEQKRSLSYLRQLKLYKFRPYVLFTTMILVVENLIYIYIYCLYDNFTNVTARFSSNIHITDHFKYIYIYNYIYIYCVRKNLVHDFRKSQNRVKDLYSNYFQMSKGNVLLYNNIFFFGKYRVQKRKIYCRTAMHSL